ncbi:MAG: hypothetical protein NXY57DRAFT_887550 [Lentinula lateritia]|uniref:Uncharacterized protein n=1 Tax=Lentinula lateritia TaxID=40482 RepID=A0ABQ8VWZ7_9AGAR|nr:MAG: hypothetical protein NXY57DRAFT_887550 [Lentinula lateritia]KAJ4500917.1 hypothetical protein C8R41DRAFT_750492 [Lentinula lateritia]
MAYQQSVNSLQMQQDVVSGEQYRYALTNFRIAHEKVEEQRAQLEEQERQVAQLRARIALLEGGSAGVVGKSGNSVDDFSIKNAAAQLEKMINRWASDIVRSPPVSLIDLCGAILNDLASTITETAPRYDGSSIQVQSLLRHIISETISEGIINCLVVTNSPEANDQLTRIHEHIFVRDPTIASVWRRQTYSAAVDSCSPDMTASVLVEHMPALLKCMDGALPTTGGKSIIDAAYDFSRMIHGSHASSGDAFYRAFVPELGSTLSPRQNELVKRCMRSEAGNIDRVGATVFPGLVKVSKGPAIPGQEPEIIQTVVRRAQVICECALTGSSIPPSASMLA